MPRLSRSRKALTSHQATILIFILIGLSLSACAPPAMTSYRLLSDEVISQVKSPPYSREQVRQAQASLRWRIAHRIRDVNIQSELKSFACLIISQRLDPTSARGERAPSRVPCISNPKRLCSHGCKRSRLARDLRLPAEYADVARRHDDILWADLQAIAPREESPPWERYLTDCLACQRSAEVKRLICERDLKGVDLTAERTPYTPLDRWLNQCESLSNPKIQSLVAYRASMLTPAEDLPYPAVIPHLSESLQRSLSDRAMIGEGERLAVSSLDSARITALLSSQGAQTLDDPRWLTLRDQLKRRLDVELMPCLERGLEACLVAGQVRLTLKQAPRYLSGCQLCEYQGVVRDWLDQVALGLTPVWHSHHEIQTQTLLRRQEPPALITHEAGTISRIRLGRHVSTEERLTWTREVTSDERRDGARLWEPQARWAAVGRGRAPHLLISDQRQLHALDPRDGSKRWSYRFPFSQDGEVIACDRVEPIPTDAIGGRLSQGGALCYRRDSMLFLNALGEPSLTLSCDRSRGCGELLALTANDVNAFKAQLSLIIKHEELSDQGEQEAITLTRYNLSKLDIMTSAVESREPDERTGARWDDVLDVSWALDRALPSLLVTSQERGGVSLRLIDAQSGRERWKRSLRGQRLLYAPSVRVTRGVADQERFSQIGVLTQRGFTLISLSSGDLLRNERIALRGRIAKPTLKQARHQALSWEISNDQLTLLHPLNNKLYTSMSQAPLKKSALTLKDLDPRARLSTLYDQWVVTSPSQGEVFGVTLRGDRVAWTWRVKPFTSTQSRASLGVVHATHIPTAQLDLSAQLR